MRMPETQTAIDKAGGVNALAKLINISSAAVATWKRIPTRRIKAVEAATGIPRHVLRPDLYDAPSTPPPAPVPAEAAQ